MDYSVSFEKTPIPHVVVTVSGDEVLSIPMLQTALSADATIKEIQDAGMALADKMFAAIDEATAKQNALQADQNKLDVLEAEFKALDLTQTITKADLVAWKTVAVEK